MKRNLIVYSLLFVSFCVLVFLLHCTRDNPFDINSENFIRGKKPLVHFTDSLITGYVLDTIDIRVHWKDTAIGGIPGTIEKCLIDWDGEGEFSDTIDDIPEDTLIVKRVFNPRENWIKIKMIDSEGDTSDIDSAFLEIKTSTPRIVSIEAPDTAKKGVPFTIHATGSDTGGFITSWIWAVNGTEFSKATDSGSLEFILDSVGENTIQVRTRDNKMIESAIRIITVHVIDLSDSVGPQITFVSPLQNDTIRSQQWNVSAQVLDQSGVSGVTLNDSVAMQKQEVGSLWRGTVFLTEGENTLKLTAVDTKGYITEKQISIVVVLSAVDLFPPVVRLLAPVRWSDTISTSSLSVRMFVNDESGVVSVLFDGDILQPDSTDGSYSAERELQEGINRFLIRSVDTKGNVQSDTLSVFWDNDAIDSIPPVLTILEPTFRKHIFDSVAIIKGTVTDAAKILSVKVNDVGATLDYPFWSAKVSLRSGVNAFTVIATDNSVNRNSAEKQVSVVSNELPVFTSSPRDTLVYLGRTLSFSASVTDDDTGVGYTITRSQITYGTVTPLVKISSGVEFTYTAAKPGIDTFKLAAMDSWEDIASIEWRVTALALSDSAPRFTNNKLPDTAFVSDTLRTAVRAVDPNDLQLVYSFKGQKPTGAIIDSASGDIVWTPSAADTGVKEFTINVSNGLQDGMYMWRLTVLPKNRPPEFLPLGNLTADENERLLVVLNAIDPNKDHLEFSFGGTFPDGAKLDSNKLSWTPAFTDSGTHTVVFVVRERNRQPSLSDTQTIIIRVRNINQKPVFQKQGLVTGVMNQLLSLTLKASDPDGDSVSYGMLGAPASATLTGKQFRWTPEPADTGTRTVRFIASDSRLSDTIEVAIKINKENRAPVLADPGNKSVNENQSIQFKLSATDPDNDSLIFSIENRPSGAIFEGRTFRWRPAYTQSGTYNVKFTVSDNVVPSLSSSRTVTIVVTDVNASPILTRPGDRTVNENEELQFSLHATDVDGDTLTYSTLESLPAGARLNGNNFSWTPNIDQAGSWPVTFIVEDNGNPRLQDRQSITITVRNINRAPVVTDTSFTVNEDSQISFQIRASDPDGVEPPLRFISTNPPLDAMITPNGQFNWRPSYTQAGNYPITVIVQDTSDRTAILSTTATISITVNNVNRPPVFTDSSSMAGTELVPISFALSATDPDNDQLIFSSGNLPGNAGITSGVFSWTPTLSDSGIYDVVFVVRESDGGSAALSDTATIRITIHDLKPTIPAALYPGDGATAQPVSIPFRWKKALSADGYHLQIAADPQFDALIDEDSTTGINDTSTTISGLANGSTYYWRVRALNPGSGSEWSVATRFSTIASFQLNITPPTNGSIARDPDLASYDSATVVTLTAQAADGFGFVGWDGDLSGSINPATITMDAAKIVTATFTQTLHNLELVVDEGGGGTTYPAQGTTVEVAHGVTTTITAFEDESHAFNGWTVLSGDPVIANPLQSITSVILTNDARIEANFTVKTYQLSVSTRAGGTTTPSSPISVNHGVATPVEATINDGYTFDSWIVTSGDPTIEDPTNPTTTVILTGNATVVASYIYTLTLSTNGSGGLITTPGDPSVTAQYDVPVSIVAEPATGYTFTHWTVVSGTAYVGNLESPSTTLRLQDNAHLRANFTNSVYTLSVVATDHGTIIAPSPAIFTTTLGTVVLATAEAEPGYQFKEWIVTEGEAEITNNIVATTNIRVTGNATVQAVFAINSYTVNATSAGNGSVSPEKYTGDHGTEILINATAETGYKFSGWEIIDGSSFGHTSLNENPVEVTLTGNGTIRANFVPIYTLDVISSDEEGGTIMDPSSGSIGNIIYDSIVTVTAQENPGYSFTGWEVVDGSATIEGDNTISARIRVQSNATIRANFVQTFRVTVEAQSGGEITKPSETQPFTVNYGDTIDIVTRPLSETDVFNEWKVEPGDEGDVTFVSDKSLSINRVVFTGDAKIIAIYNSSSSERQ
ncbi:MAG: tandem-95 repeat protein [Chitinispirillaceae bacterium]|nr:tandem-95 repeat protein [Chitinispirillaceae bacterium]